MQRSKGLPIVCLMAGVLLLFLLFLIQHITNLDVMPSQGEKEKFEEESGKTDNGSSILMPPKQLEVARFVDKGREKMQQGLLPGAESRVIEFFNADGTEATGLRVHWMEDGERIYSSSVRGNVARIPRDKLRLMANSDFSSPVILSLNRSEAKVVLPPKSQLLLKVIRVDNGDPIPGVKVDLICEDQYFKKEAEWSIWLKDCNPNRTTNELGEVTLQNVLIQEWPGVGRWHTRMVLSPPNDISASYGGVELEFYKFDFPESYIAQLAVLNKLGYRLIDKENHNWVGAIAWAKSHERGQNRYSAQVDPDSFVLFSMPIQGDFEAPVEVVFELGEKVWLRYCWLDLWRNSTLEFDSETFPAEGRIEGAGVDNKTLEVCSYPLSSQQNFELYTGARFPGDLRNEDLIWHPVGEDGGFKFRQGWIGPKTAILVKDSRTGRIMGWGIIEPGQLSSINIRGTGTIFFDWPKDQILDLVSIQISLVKNQDNTILLNPEGDDLVRELQLPWGIYEVQIISEAVRTRLIRLYVSGNPVTVKIPSISLKEIFVGLRLSMRGRINDARGEVNVGNSWNSATGEQIKVPVIVRDGEFRVGAFFPTWFDRHFAFRSKKYLASAEQIVIDIPEGIVDFEVLSNDTRFERKGIYVLGFGSPTVAHHVVPLEDILANENYFPEDRFYATLRLASDGSIVKGVLPVLVDVIPNQRIKVELVAFAAEE